MKILITGAAGFIGFHLSQRLVRNGNKVIGIDNLNSYYDPKLKEARLEILNNYNDLFSFKKINLEDKRSIKTNLLKI